ncbi:MAG: chemotaxis protein CheW [Myxococcaceae bacterium]
MSQALLPLRLDGNWVAIDALLAREVLGRRPFVPIPGASAGLPGVIAWKGRAIAVVDLLAMDGGPAKPSGEPRERTVVVQVGETTFALPVDAVREVQVASEEQLHLPRATRVRFAEREVELDGTALPVLDLAAVVAALTAPAGEG